MSTLTKRNGGLRLFPRTLLSDDFFNWSWRALPSLDLNGDETWLPAANLKEGEKSFTVELSVPGYTRKDIKVEVDENNVLNISGERKEETKVEKKNYTRREFSYGTFSRSFRLPETVNEAEISAKCVDGVLIVELPKTTAAVSKKNVKKIAVS